MRLEIRLFPIVAALATLLSLESCVSTRPIQYVQGQFDTAQISKYITREPVIQKADIINIIVFSDNPAATTVYNLANATGYLVDDRGNIQFQGIGNLMVEGLTKSQLSALLDSKLKEVLQNPYYSIRFVNFRITMIGEVVKEGQYPIPSERVNILEAIGLAGGLTIYAKRENVMIVREVNGHREFARLDLTNPQLFQSPYYFLQQNDLVVVEQKKSKISNNDQSTVRSISLASTVISTLLVIYTVFRR